MKKFLIINPFGIGDVLFTTPVIKAIKNSFPDSYIGYSCNERVAPLFRNNPHIDKIFALSRGDIKEKYRKSRFEGMMKLLKVIKNIKKERFDISLDFSLDYRNGLIGRLIGIKKRVGLNYKRNGRFLTDKINIIDYQNKHMVERYLGVLGLIDISPKDKKLELYADERSSEWTNKLFMQSGISSNDMVIGIAPGAGASWGKNAPLKHWPSVRFAQLADKISDNLNAKILILGDISERYVAETIINRMKNKPIDLVGKTTLEQLIAIMSKLQLLITNDGGPLHMAVALNKRTVSFFGPVDPVVYGPYPFDIESHIVLRKALECSPCYRNFIPPTCQRDKECLKRIDVDEAFLAVTSLLNKSKM
ncbi:MAG: glycosyltransferase family 9 protein [Candidatus Omnitrophica bacterium]|nr:glycosyltransferase family 9 protein [Candidatus Omnitrophota bacterium]